MAERIPILARARDHGPRTAIVDGSGTHTYDDLLARSAQWARVLQLGEADLKGARVAYMVEPGFEHVAIQWGIWRAGGVAVPLCLSHPAPELSHVLEDSRAATVVADPGYRATVRPLAALCEARFVDTSASLDSPPTKPPALEPSRAAMLIYTSGTTGKPKGVLTTHEILSAQIRSVVKAWAWTGDDRVLHTLPLHHLHGVLNLLCAALWSGAACEMLPRFDADEVWRRIANSRELTLFMAVPTIYAKLARAYEDATPEAAAKMSEGCGRMRLMVSGSAALPLKLFESWRALSGHDLLERYGMTEFGMGLGNPLEGERRRGHVGQPFPGVEVRLVDDEGAPTERQGHVQVRSPGMFHSYWANPAATAESFTDDGWFKTGDVATLDDGYYRILGRQSVDILKTGGYKVSALEIEEVLRDHPDLDEVAVVGVDDDEWGQRVAAAVVLRPGASLELGELRHWAKQRLAPYKVPTLLQCLDALPRNPMGKVTKADVTALFTDPH